MKKSRMVTVVVALATAVCTLGAAGCGDQATNGDRPAGGETGSTTAPATGGAGAGTGATGGGTASAGTPTAAQLNDAVTKALNADATIKGYNLKVEAMPEQYMVALKGTVPSDTEKYRAEQVAVDAIKNPTFAIDNQLEVKP